MGIALHYFLTAMFSWMLVEGWHLYLAVIEVFSAQRRSLLKRYYVLGYGEFVLVIVVLFSHQMVVVRCLVLEVP